jgi:hypothetical protein
LILQTHKRRYPFGRGGFSSKVLCNANRLNDEPTVRRLLEFGANPDRVLRVASRYKQRVTPFFPTCN